MKVKVVFSYRDCKLKKTIKMGGRELEGDTIEDIHQKASAIRNNIQVLVEPVVGFHLEAEGQIITDLQFNVKDQTASIS